ncbi:DUF3789 domain-containing protein [Lachnospiraceae bacterium]|nr:DUF3789 domain-containing protein [Lachnospiraceae bacterium]
MNVICFLAGIFIGSMIGVVFMCLLQINRCNQDDVRKENKKQKQNHII